MIRLDEKKDKSSTGRGWYERTFVALPRSAASRLPNEAFSRPKIKASFLPSFRGASLCYWQVGRRRRREQALQGSDTSVEPSIFASSASKTSWPKRHLASCCCFCKPKFSVKLSENGGGCRACSFESLYCSIEKHVQIEVGGTGRVLGEELDLHGVRFGLERAKWRPWPSDHYSQRRERHWTLAYFRNPRDECYSFGKENRF